MTLPKKCYSTVADTASDRSVRAGFAQRIISSV
jgi:hypothetical protein